MSIEKSNYVAAIDMGSNSFHMVIGRIAQGELQLLDKLAVKVQLGAGLVGKGELSYTTQNAALDCLAMYKQRMQGIPKENIRVVGTNALRIAKNRAEFIDKAEELLGLRVDVISGVEEARLIYLGVAHSLADDSDRRLVIDIGGGSTEFIIGRRFEPKCLESLHLGCVTFKERYFPNGKIVSREFDRAILEARREVASIMRNLKRIGWVEAVGSSGTARSVRQVMIGQGWTDDAITLEGLKKLKMHLLALGRVENLQLEGLKEDRRIIFPSGVAILIGIFQQLQIEQMYFSEGALREGLLYDQLGRIQHEDVRDRTVLALQERYYLDKDHASKVESSAIYFYEQIKESWDIERPEFHDVLSRAALLHEIGLAISHSQFHKHGGYLLKHSDLAGFSTAEQAVVSVLVRTHRRKFSIAIFEELYDTWFEPAQRLSALLRLAVLLNHSRSESEIHQLKLSVLDNRLTLVVPRRWIADRPLTLVDLEQEQRYLAKGGYHLRIVEQP